MDILSKFWIQFLILKAPAIHWGRRQSKDTWLVVDLLQVYYLKSIIITY